MPVGGYYVEDVRWSTDEAGEPFIACVIDGQPARVPMMQKTVLLEADIVRVFGDIERAPVRYKNTTYDADAGFVTSAYLAREVVTLTRAYEGRYMESDPRFTPGL